MRRSIKKDRFSHRTGGGNGSISSDQYRASKNGDTFSGPTTSSNEDSVERADSLLSVSTNQVARVPPWKRILDLTCIVLSFPFWLPIVMVVMAFIRITSPGPIFYRQERIGYRRSRFMLFKFRTMHVNADTRTHEEYFAHLIREECPMIKLDAADDPRLIPGARFLRASGLDELPQIFNVLRGEMSLVGPRPCLPHEFERYESWQQQRVNALPGLTGYWQVNGKNNTTFQEMIVMDLFYARNMSIWLDLRVISKTLPVLGREILEAWNRYRSRSKSRALAAAEAMPIAPSLNGAVERK